MGSIKIVNTTTIKNVTNELENHRKYYSNKKSSFSSSTFGYQTKLYDYLSKIQGIYGDLSQNINNINFYLKEYISDVEGLENQMKGSIGTVSVYTVNNIIKNVKNTIKNYDIDPNNLFEVTYYNGNTSDWDYDNVNPLIGGAATVATCGLSFLEGVINVGEMIVDGGGMLVSGACSILGFDNAANSVGNFVKEDWSKDLYYWTTSSTGLDRYADPDGTAANICSMAGNVAGMVGLSVVTGGAAAGAFGAGTAAATTATMATNAAIGALSNMGSEGEAALERGATVTEAEEAAVVAGGVGLVQGAISGKFDAAARAAGAGAGNIGIGTICKYALASFGVGSAEPLVNEMAQTVIYRNDEESGFINNFLSNSKEDGLLFQMALAGGTNALGTIGNGIGGIRRYNTLSKQIENAMNGTNTSVIEIEDVSEISSSLMEKITDPNKVLFKVGDKIIDINSEEFLNLREISSNNSVLDENLKQLKENMSSFYNKVIGKISPELAEASNFSEMKDIALKILSDKLEETLGPNAARIVSNLPDALKGFLSYPISFIGRLKYTDVTTDDLISAKILDEGLYHVTSMESGEKILASSFVKASGNITSYGSKKSFFFAGVPSAENIAVNITPELPDTLVAVKFDVQPDSLGSFKFRDLSDHAVTFGGDYHFEPSQAKMVYLGLTEIDGKLRYVPISLDEFSNYKFRPSKTVLDKIANNTEGLVLAFAQEFDYNKKILDKFKKSLTEVFGITPKLADDVPTSSGLRHLTVEELEDKISEYNKLLDGNERLRQIIQSEQNGLTVELSDDIMDDYIRLKLLQSEIEPEYNASLAGLNQRVEDAINQNINTADLLEERLIASIGKREDYLKIIEEIQTYTDDNLPVGYSSVKEMKDSIVRKLKSSDVLSSMSNGDFFALIQDKYILEQFIGSDKLNDLIVKNLGRIPDTCVGIFKDLSDVELNGAFVAPIIKEFFSSMSDDEFLKVLTSFNKNNSSVLFSSETFRNRFFNMNSEKLIDFFNHDYTLYGLLGKNKNANGQAFLEAILDAFGNEEFLLDHPELSDKLASLAPYCDEFAYYREIMSKFNERVIANLKEKLAINSLIDIPSSGILSDVDGYYDITYTINGQSFTKSINASFGSYDLLHAFTSKNYDDIMSGKIKIVSISENAVKNALNIGNVSQNGLNVITLEIDGKVEQIVKNVTYNSLDLNYSFSGRDISDVKILSIKALPQSSYNTICDNASSIYKLTYTLGGIEQVGYLLPSKNGMLDIDSYIISKNLYNIENINVQKLDIDDSMRNNGSIFRFKNGSEIFGSTYGGNQSDARRLVISSLEGETLSQIDTAKSQLLIGLIKKYYPNASNTDIKNIIKAYEESGCCYMAVANNLATYMNSVDNGTQLFKDKIGYDLYFSDGSTKSYNLEAIALDIYLNSHKNAMGYSDIDTLLKHSSGVSGITYAGFMNDYFESRGIKIDADVIHVNKNNYNLDMLRSLLSLDKETFPIIAASKFDLESLEIDDIISSADGALANASQVGNLIKDIGGHAMTITGISDLNEFIVSSWSKKYKFKPTSETSGTIFTLKFNLGG